MTDLGRFDEALNDFNTALNLKPHFTEAKKNKEIALKGKKGIKLEALHSLIYWK
ncbi:hypothetical protein MFUM_1070002 [Methylacidiphilum fumariolicum SolV]|uniref:Uncharacterized protein n=2 Tax=Candidatus Methylacidiphilum fumarolicum TaxID=591154 RepID=I0JW60_METFB|nr:TPR_REGION domain-containing protein [Candidatus Methylacidiphilum fumarolicum]CCG91479.1 hypothetical protein MFUM_1070002 [Methylacidiphilum fumariolicum SolV]